MQTTDITYTSADGLALFAKSYGPPDAKLNVLCMHGLTRNHKDFEPMIAKLPTAYRYIAVDVRGRGQSARDPNPENYTPAIYADDMQRLLDHLEIKKAALIGTSMGGLMSMVMAKNMPQRISGIILNDVGPELDQVGLDRIACYAGKVEPVKGWLAASETTRQSQQAVFPSYKSEDWLAFAKRTYRELGNGKVILDYDPAITRTVQDVKPGLKTRILMWRLFTKMKPMPLLIIRGETSDILSPKTAARMLKRHPNATLLTVKGVGHAPLLDEPEAITAISEFLELLV